MIQEFFILGTIIVIGFFSMMFFERTKIPDVIFLILLGVLLGPIFNVIDISQTSIIYELAPFIGTLALVILLFDGGINLNIFRVMKEIGRASTFTFLVFIISVFLVGVAMFFLGPWPLAEGLLLGAVIGGSSSAAVISIITKIRVGEEPKTLLTLESTMTDALSVIGALLFAQIIISKSVNLSIFGSQIASAFSIGIVLAILFAAGWAFILQRFYGKPFGYLLTIAVLLIQYSIVEAMGGSGAISILVFGIALASSEEFAKLLKIQGNFHLEDKMRQFQTEVSFFVRTFFFVYLGLMINIKELSPGLVSVSAALVLLIILARFLGIRLLGKLFADGFQNSLILTMIPRDLIAAVLTFLLIGKGVSIPYFQEIMFLVILLTNVVATVGVYRYESLLGAAKPRIIRAGTRYPYAKKKE